MIGFTLRLCLVQMHFLGYAYFVDVHKPEEIAEGVIAISKDKTLRDRLIKRGYDIARKYALEAVGERLEKILQNHVTKMC